MIYTLLLTPGGGYSWEFLVGAAWVSKSWPSFRPKNGIFTPVFRPGISNSHISISFLFIWNVNNKYVHTCTLPWFPRTKKGPKTLPFGAAHTYIAYIRESPPVLIPFMIIETELAGLRMGVENSTLVRLVIQRTGRHTPPPIISRSIYNFHSRVFLFSDLLILFSSPRTN